MPRFREKCQARETKTSERRRVHLLLTGERTCTTKQQVVNLTQHREGGD